MARPARSSSYISGCIEFILFCQRYLHAQTRCQLSSFIWNQFLNYSIQLDYRLSVQATIVQLYSLLKLKMCIVIKKELVYGLVIPSRLHRANDKMMGLNSQYRDREPLGLIFECFILVINHQFFANSQVLI
ncbi:hypothetical protein FGO68_gene4436 [Halteria grandinella]|uniref:Uncharacterized protein n=1 Tax=Halteria grandinella TaxID=5974 RepID=A0A8J8T9R4_HALGN|nr:hypothetical protein FGO68_gene4436 [Halteria grandinella]